LAGAAFPVGTNLAADLAKESEDERTWCPLRVAAVQTETIVGDIAANLAGCERLADEAAREGARWILLPELFTTGMGFLPELLECAMPPDGPAIALLIRLAKRHDAVVGGSFLCRDHDDHIRNAFFLATPQGVAGRHDKDIPTMWENCFYVGGTDDGVIHPSISDGACRTGTGGAGIAGTAGLFLVRRGDGFVHGARADACPDEVAPG
jgi:predicted amidohydrolase